MNAVVPQEELSLQTQLAQARERLDGLVQELRAVDGELEALSAERQQYHLLQDVCDSLEKLSELDAGDLFWGERLAGGKGDDHVGRVRGRVDAFQARVGEIEGRRQGIVARIGQEEEGLDFLEEDLFQAQQAEERRKLEWIVEREISALPVRGQVMPWTRGGDDDRRFRKSLATSLLLALLLGVLMPQIDLPLPSRDEVIEMPERFTRLIRQELQRPVPPPAVVQEEPRPDEPKLEEPKPEPVEEQKPIEEPLPLKEQPLVAEAPAPGPPQPQPRKTESTGILAFREKFSNIPDNKPSARLGAQARISGAGDSTPGLPQRSMVTTQAPGSSGGINLASLSRDVGGGGGGGEIAGVQLTRAASSIGAGGVAGGSDRPLSGGPGAGRTDEEIQIVFDRHKAALYRLYNRELRRDPTLQGQMVLRIRIEPDGSVTQCELQGTDMNAPDLSAQILDRVRTFNFGAKEVPTVTILYPIDFLPAA